MLKKLKIGDKLVIVLVILFSFVSFVLVFNFKNDVAKDSVVSIYHNNELVEIVPLNVNATILIEQEFSNTIVVSNNQVRVVNSTCPDKLCENFGNSNAIICLPNKLLIEISNIHSEFDV